MTMGKFLDTSLNFSISIHKEGRERMPIGHGEFRCENLPGGLMVLPRQTVVLVTLALALSGPAEAAPLGRSPSPGMADSPIHPGGGRHDPRGSSGRKVPRRGVQTLVLRQ